MCDVKTRKESIFGVDFGPIPHLCCQFCRRVQSPTKPLWGMRGATHMGGSGLLQCYHPPPSLPKGLRVAMCGTLVGRCGMQMARFKCVCVGPQKTTCSTHCNPNLQVAAKWACWGQFGRFLVLWTHLIKPDTIRLRKRVMVLTNTGWPEKKSQHGEPGPTRTAPGSTRSAPGLRNFRAAHQ